MNKFIRVKFLKHGTPTGNAYTYSTKEPVEIGDIVMISEKAKGVVVGFAVMSMVVDKDSVKEIYGVMKKEEESNESNNT